MLKKSPMFRAGSVLAAAATALVLSGCGQSAAESQGTGGDDTLTFAAIPAESSQSLRSSFEAIVGLLEQETGKTVEFQDATDYAAVIEGQRAGQIDMASYGPFSYVIAKDGGVPVEPLAAPVHEEAAIPAYTSLAYVKAGSDITSLEEVKGKKVCFVDAASTSGYLVPTKGLMDASLDPEQDITPVMAGGHDASLLSVESGQCDVAFGHDTIEKTLIGEGQLEEGALTSIWESEPITEDPIAVNTETVDEQTRQTIATALREKANKPYLVESGICASEEECVLPEEIEWGYVPVTDADYDAIREVCEVTKADACQS